jgi:hypothetical protein
VVLIDIFVEDDLMMERGGGEQCNIMYKLNQRVDIKIHYFLEGAELN